MSSLVRTWVSPDGSVYNVAGADLYIFCQEKNINYENMLDHIERETSDQKNGGWRLIERLRAIGHISRPDNHVLALGTIEEFYKECLTSDDGRAVLKNRDNLGRLLGGKSKGGKPWNGWECRKLSSTEKLQLLQAKSKSPETAHVAADAAAAVSISPSSSTIRLLYYATALELVDGLTCAGSSSRLDGSPEVSLGSFLGSI